MSDYYYDVLENVYSDLTFSSRKPKQIAFGDIFVFKHKR